MIQQLQAEQPDIKRTKLRWLLGQANPGQYGHHKKTWANEATKQINALYPEPNKKPRRGVGVTSGHIQAALF